MKKLILAFGVFLYSSLVSGQTNYNMSLLGHIDLCDIHSAKAANLWGWADGNGNEYAIVGLSKGVSVVDVTDPTNPTEVFFQPGAQNIWREVKVWNNHAYITTEAREGLLIIDLSTLPGDPNLFTTYYSVSGTIGDNPMSAHTLFIDENGICYLFGANRGNGGAIMLDLGDPKNPVEIGNVDNWYVHDGYARKDTLFLANINNGWFSIFDVRDKSNPVFLGLKQTPSRFTHNIWLSDDMKYAYTTDEVSGAFITEYDVSDLGAISETDRIRTYTREDVIPHNTHFINDFIVTSYYRDGVIIHDVSQRGNMIEVALYDTSPFLQGNGFNGCWGVFPYFPSGNVIASDIELGLFVLAPEYKRGCYLEGVVTDIATGDPIPNVKVEILSTPITKNANFSGEYKSGYGVEGFYSVLFSHPSYPNKTINNVQLQHGLITQLDVQLGVAVSLTGNQQLDLDIYPNPFTDRLLVKTVDTNLSIKLYNVLGDVVLQQKITPGTPIKLPQGTASGIYFIRVLKNEEVVLTKKMIKQ
jgi:choice-of-anchor B domain-containing protein